MTVTANSFRRDFVEFSESSKYPDSLVDFYLAIAVKMLNASRWGTMLDVGVELFTAHNLTLERIALDEMDNGGVPGITKGPISSQSVDKSSVSFDVAAAAELDAGHWNETIYGKRFIRIARMMGAGPVQIGAGYCGGGALLSTDAWAGPWPWNFPNPSG